MHLIGRLKTGERIASVSALVLLVSMFLDWFVVEIPDSTGVSFFLDGTRQSAWDTLDYISVFLAITIIAALAVAVLRLAGMATEALRPVNVLVAVLGLVSVLLISYRIIDPPDVDGSFEGFMETVTAERAVQFGIFIGLIGAAGITVGGYRAATAESPSDARE